MIPSRKGFQLSVNMLVVIILGIVLLGMGITLVTKMVGQGQEYTEKVDRQLMDQLRKSQFSDGRLVAVLSSQQRASAGEFVEFLVGFRNNEDQSRDFEVVVEFNEDSSPVNLDSDEADAASDALRYLSEGEELAPNEDSFMWVGVAVPGGLPAGDYFYDVYVCYDGSSYKDDDNCPGGKNQLYSGSKQRLFVNVR
ncbi:MAG: hypothetical protein ACLFO2_02835 [Candidatus Woesearchaeota archaeon]